MHQYKPSSVFGFAVNGLLIFTSLGTMIYGHRYSFILRISGGYLAIAVLMLILPLVTNALEPGPAFAADLCILVVFGVFGGIVQASTFALGGILPGKYMGAIMLGNGLSGISLNVVRIICLVAIPHDFYLGALVYFILAAVILLICAWGQWKFQQLPFVKHYIKIANDEKNRTQRRISHAGEDFFNKDSAQAPLIIPDSLNKSELSAKPGNRLSEVTSNTNRASNNYLPLQKEQMDTSGNRQSQAEEAAPKISPLKAFLIMMRNSFILAW